MRARRCSRKRCVEGDAERKACRSNPFLYQLDESVIKPGAAAIRQGNAVESIIDGMSKLGKTVSEGTFFLSSSGS